MFAPLREHARFCSAGCRLAWNRQYASPPAGDGALVWSVAAMRETTDRLLQTGWWNAPDAFAVITEAVWWVTMVDATLVRYHPETYGEALASHGRNQRKTIEGTFAGLRFVRNRMGCEADPEEFIQPRPNGSGASTEHLEAWTWRPAPEPDVTSLPPRGQVWELSRFSAYQSELAGRPIGGTFRCAAAFLLQASDSSISHL